MGGVSVQVVSRNERSLREWCVRRWCVNNVLVVARSEGICLRYDQFTRTATVDEIINANASKVLRKATS